MGHKKKNTQEKMKLSILSLATVIASTSAFSFSSSTKLSLISSHDIATSTSLSVSSYLDSLDGPQPSTTSWAPAAPAAPTPSYGQTTQGTTGSYLDNLGGASAAPVSSYSAPAPSYSAPAASSSNGFDAYEAQMRASEQTRIVSAPAPSYTAPSFSTPVSSVSSGS